MLFLQLILALSQQSTLVGVAGYVTDDSTGAPIHGARVELADASAWTLTDSLGYYALETDQGGTQRLRVTRLGYESQALAVLLPTLGPMRVDIALRAHAALMPLVRISALRLGPHRAASAPFNERYGSLRRWSSAQLAANPALAEADALAAFGTDADVSLAPESPNALYVRGGSSDQTRFLIDGVPFYNPAHSAGVLGALNPDAFDGVALHTGARTASFGSALAGTIDAQTRRGDSTRVRLRGGVNATSLRLTVDGPVAAGRSDFVLSARRGSPSILSGRPDKTRLTAAFSDWLAKSDTRIGNGTLTLLATAAKDRTGFSTRAEADSVSAPTYSARHHFDWGAATTAALWFAPLAAGSELRVNAWRAEFDGDATWFAAAPLHMSSARHTYGIHTSLVRRRAGSESRIGLDLERDRVAYSVHDEKIAANITDASWTNAAQSSVAIFAEQLARIGARWDVRPGLRTTLLASGRALVEPRVITSYQLTPNVTISSGLARMYQSVQSLRNAESPAAAVFGADLPVLAGKDIPISRADEATLGLAATFGVRWRLTLDGYARQLTDIVVASPGIGVPFSVEHPTVAGGRVWGIAGTVDVHFDRLTARLAAGSGRTSFDPGTAVVPSAAYQPGFASRQSLTMGAAYRLDDRTSFRSAVFANWGRRTTLFDGVLDWEGCDVLDGGCEIAGSPGRALREISGSRLPPYVRWDVGARRAWTARVAGREVVFEGHATVRNVLDRRNVWGFSLHGDAAPHRLMLRPLSVLTAGLDFRH